MKSKESLPFFIIILMVGSIACLTTHSITYAQNNTNKNLTNNTAITLSNGGSSGGGMSTNSVEIANSNTKDLSVNSTAAAGNDNASSNGGSSGGGMSTNSVEKAKASS